MTLAENEHARVNTGGERLMFNHLLNGSPNLGWSPHYSDGGTHASPPG